MRADKTATTEPVPEPTTPVDVPEKEGADIRCYRAGYEDGYHFAVAKFVEGLSIGLMVYFSFRLFRVMLDE